MKKVPPSLNKLLVVLGPTATGKTDVALKFARQFNGELVACDSRQVYKGLDIGTGKVPGEAVTDLVLEDGRWIIDGIPIYMYDVAPPQSRYTVYDYINQASRVIEDIIRRGKLPILVGGTGFYLKGLLEGLPNMTIPNDENLRGELEALTTEQLQVKLKSLSPIHWEKMNHSDQNNPRRLIRAIELISMYPYEKTKEIRSLSTKSLNVLKIGLTAPRPILNQRIDQRLSKRISQGLIEEGEKLVEGGLSLNRLKELGLEYGVLADLFSGDISRTEFEERLKTKIHQYAKRQLTWFKTDQQINWFDISDKRSVNNLEKIVKQWYD